MAENNPDENITDPDAPVYEQMELPLGIDTPEADAERARLQAELAVIRRTNAAKMTELAALSARPNPTSVLSTRIETLINLALNDFDRLHFELAFEKGMVEGLDICLTEARKLAFTRGVPSGNGQPPGDHKKIILPGS